MTPDRRKSLIIHYDLIKWYYCNLAKNQSLQKATFSLRFLKKLVFYTAKFTWHWTEALMQSFSGFERGLFKSKLIGLSWKSPFAHFQNIINFEIFIKFSFSKLKNSFGLTELNFINKIVLKLSHDLLRSLEVNWGHRVRLLF